MVVFSIKFTCATFTGRYDIARALEKWGGLHEVSRLLSLKVRHPNRQGNPSKDLKIDYITSTDAGGESKTPSKPYISLDTQKWLKKLKTFGHQLGWMRMQPFIYLYIGDANSLFKWYCYDDWFTGLLFRWMFSDFIHPPP